MPHVARSYGRLLAQNLAATGDDNREGALRIKVFRGSLEIYISTDHGDADPDVWIKRASKEDGSPYTCADLIYYYQARYEKSRR